MNIEEIKSQMQQFFEERKNQVQTKAKELQSMGETDLAQLEIKKIEVYDIFGEMLDSSVLKAITHPKYAAMDKVKALSQEYMLSFIGKPASEWRMKLAGATGMKNWQDMTIEELKLATVQEIKDEFLRITKQK